MLTWKFARFVFNVAAWALSAALALGFDRMQSIMIALPWLTTPFFWVPAITLFTVLITLDVSRFLRDRAASKNDASRNDMTMRDFIRHYLRFEAEWALQFKSVDMWLDAVHRAVEDELRLGHIKCWGRVLRPAVQYTPLRPIPQDFWNGYTLDLRGIMMNASSETNKTSERPVLGTDELYSFCDLQVNRAQVEKIWPRAGWVGRNALRGRLSNVSLGDDVRLVVGPIRWATIQIRNKITSKCKRWTDVTRETPKP